MPQGTNEWLHEKVQELDEILHEWGISLFQSSKWDPELWHKYKEVKAERNAYLNCIIHLLQEELENDKD